MTKKWTALFLCFVLVFSLSACGAVKQESAKEKNKIKVTVSFNAMKELTEAIGKNKIEISTIIPNGTEPHDFEPKPKDMVSLSQADVFVYSGLGMEPWAKEMMKTSQNAKLIAVEASQGVVPIINKDAGESKEHGQYDPHSWLSLKNAEMEALNIKNALIKADSFHQDFYEANYKSFVKSLEKIMTEYKLKFQTVPKKDFVTGHAAFAYLCRDFGLTQKSVEDVFAEGEPSTKQLAELVNYCKQNNVTTVFAEEMASPDVSKALAAEVGAKVKTIYTIENNEDNKTYLERMSDDLKEIYESLK